MITELLYIIIEYLDDIDIKNIRLTSKLFCEIAKKYSFKPHYDVLFKSNIASLNYIFNYNKFELTLSYIIENIDLSLTIEKTGSSYQIFSLTHITNSKLKISESDKHKLICDKFEFFLDKIDKKELLNVNDIDIINISFKKLMNIYYNEFKKYHTMCDIFDKLYNPILDILKASSRCYTFDNLNMDHNLINNKSNILIFDKIFLTDFLIECLERSTLSDNKFDIIFSELNREVYNVNFIIDFDVLYDYILTTDKIYLVDNSYRIYEFLLKNCNNKLINLYYDYHYKKTDNNENNKEITIGYNTVIKNKNKFYNKVHEFSLHKEHSRIRYENPPKKYKKFKKYRLHKIFNCTQLNNKTFNNNLIKYKTKYCLDNDLI